MHTIKPIRASRTYTQHLAATPENVFPLLCPVREKDWIEDWNPVVVISQTGIAESDCVFITPASPDDAIWYITRHEPANGFVEMVKITPQITACKLSICLRPVGNNTEATIAYTHTSLGPKGDEFVAAFTEDYYAQFMRDWESRLNHYLTTGNLMCRTDG
jgi:hypothetical protein